MVETLKRLVQIDSVNPSLSQTGPGENEIVAFIAEVLRDLGMRVDLRTPQPNRPSVIGILKGRGGGRSLMLNAHVDTVGVEGMSNPFAASVRDGRLYGRGAYDMKGSMAACLGAAKALVDAKAALAGDLLVAGVADEEFASLGTADVAEQYAVDGAIVTEPTDLKICLAHKGFIWLSMETLGRAAHGSNFRDGIDANMRMGRFLSELDTFERELRERMPHPLVGPPSLHAAVLSGGSGISTYAASCTLQIERRTIPGETAAQVVGELQEILNRVGSQDPTFRFTLETLLVREPFEVARDAPLVQTLASASGRIRGETPPFVGETPWMDSALLSAAGVETVVMGPSGTGAHSAEEWVELESVHQLAEILAETAVAYCGRA